MISLLSFIYYLLQGSAGRREGGREIGKGRRSRQERGGEGVHVNLIYTSPSETHQ